VPAALLKPKHIGLLLLAGLLIVFPFLHNWPFFTLFIGEFRTFNATMFAVWLLILLGMNLLTGYSGQVSLGHAALVLISAYMTAVLSQQYGFPLLIAIVLSATLTAVLGGVLIGLPAVRLRGPYLSIATFGLMLALPQILKLQALTRWTNGALGIRGDRVEPPGFLEAVLDSRDWLYYVAIVAAVIMTVLFLNLTRSRVGRAFVALRDSEIGAEQMGVDVPRHKALAFGISSLYAGLGGGLFFAVQGFVSPDSLSFIDSIFFLVAIVIGGLGSVLGSIFAALFLTFQAEAISELSRVIPGANDLRNVLFGGGLIATIILFPRGVAGFVQGHRVWKLGEIWVSWRRLWASRRP
jgi:branched-chain amino acid transport system permease protein